MNPDYHLIRSRISGCILAGALGDALGYPVEFYLYEDIKKRFGEKGIQDPVLTGSRAVISDDTQMTLFTMEGMTYGCRRCEIKGIGADIEYYIYLSYLRWLQTQSEAPDIDIPYNWPSELAQVQEINHRRAPGNTCLSTLLSGRMGTIQAPLNHSKGCGGVMRTAPLGFMRNTGDPMMNGAKTAAITHGNPLGWIPTGMLSDIISRIIYGQERPLRKIIEESLRYTVKQFAEHEEIKYYERLIRKAIALSGTAGSDAEHIESLGGGWVGEEALAIAIYCVLRYPDDMKKMLRAAVNHSGDSDSTGAIAGNILGAYLGRNAVPEDWLGDLEMVDVMQHKIDEMMSVIDGSWSRAYWQTQQ